MKICKECLIEKDLIHFYIDKRIKNEHKYITICKSCFHKYNYLCRSEDVRKRIIAKKWNLSEDKYNEYIKNGCNICGDAYRLAIDHSHASGKIRGALCLRCNTALGNMKENKDLLRKMISYLEERDGSASL